MKRMKKRKGVAMIFAIGVFLFVSVLAIALTRLVGSNASHSALERKKTEAEYITRAGLEIGIAALQTQDNTKGNLTLCERILEKGADASYNLLQGYSNLGSSSAKGDVINIKAKDGTTAGQVQVIVYSMTRKDGESDTLQFEYLSPDSSGTATKTINRKSEAEKTGVKKGNSWKHTWVFRVVAIGQTNDYEQVKGRLPMARQVMTAEVNIQNPQIVKIYNGF